MNFSRVVVRNVQLCEVKRPNRAVKWCSIPAMLYSSTTIRVPINLRGSDTSS